MTPLAAATGQLTGTQLESVLLPASDFPAGFATPSTGPITSGGSLTTAPATYNLATISCATFIEHLGTVGFGETAMVSGSVAAAGQAYDQFIYQFGSASAASAFVAGVQSLAGRCGILHRDGQRLVRQVLAAGDARNPGRRAPDA